MDTKTPLDSKKWTSMALGLAAGIIASAAAVLAGPVGVGVLPQVLSFIAAVTLGHIGVQGVGDAISAAKAKPDASTVTPEPVAKV